jgi:hypothetical protein
MRWIRYPLLALGALIGAYFSIRLGLAVSTYIALSQSVPARISQWEIVEIGDTFPLKASYSFEIQEKIWSGSTVLAAPRHWNEPSAIAALEGLAKQNWKAWYNPKNPSQSSLERAFPIGLLVRTSVCLSVLVYFVFIWKRLLKNCI